MKRSMAVVALALLALLGSACEDDVSGPGDPRVAEISVGPAAVTIAVGDTVRLTASAKGSDGNIIEVAFAWRSSQGERVSVEDQGSHGRVTALRVGTAVITAAAGGRTGGSTITVENPEPVAESLEPAFALRGQSGFTLTVRGAGFTPDSEVSWNGAARPTTYVSFTELRAQIAAADVAEAGEAEVRVVTGEPGGGQSAPLSFPIQVTPPGAVATVVLDADSLALEEAVQRVVVATALDAQGEVVEGRVVQWTTSDEGVARVTPAGAVTAIRPGRATITARVDGTTASLPVRVFATYPYELVFEQFTGDMVEVLRQGVREPDQEPVRIFQNERWAAQPAVSRDGSRIAVVRMDISGPRGIWLVNPDGTGVVELTAGTDDQPAWSADGATIAFRRRMPSGGTDVWAVDVATGEETNLTGDQGATNQSAPSWSPEGRIAYAHAAGGRAHVWTMAADGSARQQVTTGETFDQQPAWSPDGQRIAFERGGDIWVVNAAGGGERRIVGLFFGQFAPAWSPDGVLVAFASKDESGTFQIYTVRADGTGIAQRTFTAPEEPQPGLLPHRENPAWLPQP